MTGEFRPAGSGDQDGIAALWFEANRVRRGGRPINQVDPELIGSRIAAPGAFGFVGDDANTVVGSAVLSPALLNRGAGDAIPGLGHLNTVAVAPERWGEGIARTLLDLIVDEARTRGYARIQLFTQDHNSRARDLYQRNGWHLTGHEVVDDLGDTLVRFLREL
jgi:ribosomal protein S18 acetylase RimI-like enzyme